MSKIKVPLSDTELELLDQFLLNRIDEDADTEGLDEGVIDISTLDGLLTAVVSGPRMITPSQWLPAVWGDFEPAWEETAKFESVFSLLVRHMNSIADLLISEPDEFEPIFFSREVKDEEFLIVDEWCEGYARGISLAETSWSSGGEEIARLLAPILAFTESTDWKGHDQGIENVQVLQRAVAPSAQAIYRYWLARRQGPEAVNQPRQRSEPRIGRNDPCFCGSGKKYKRCCLQ